MITFIKKSPIVSIFSLKNGKLCRRLDPARRTTGKIVIIAESLVLCHCLNEVTRDNLGGVK